MEAKKKHIFYDIGEKDITRAIVETFTKQFSEYVESDVIIIGAGPSGLNAGRFIAKEGYKVLIVERNNYLGGGFWIGGYLMNKITLRSPSEKELDEIGVPYEKFKEGLFVADGPHACSKLIAAACDAGVKFANMSIFEDVVLREGNRVCGVVINWTPVKALPRQITCVDPVALESKIVIDSTGHEACVVKSLEQRGLIKTKGEGGMCFTGINCYRNGSVHHLWSSKNGTYFWRNVAFWKKSSKSRFGDFKVVMVLLLKNK
jgi:thiamine thiazole synthase